MPSTHFDEWIAARYETLWPELFDPAVVQPAVSVLTDIAAAGPALEFGIGTGRIAIPLSRRRARVHGIELSSPRHRPTSVHHARPSARPPDRPNR